MSILVIGGTGQVGSLVVQELAGRGASARVLTADPNKARLPARMTAVKGDLLNPASVREALHGVETLFLLNAVSPSELTQALIALDLAKEAQVKHVVYISQLKLDWPACRRSRRQGRGARPLSPGSDDEPAIRGYTNGLDTYYKGPRAGGARPRPLLALSGWQKMA